MTKEEYRALFLKALDAAAQVAEKKLGHPTPQSSYVELHAPGFWGQLVKPETAVDATFLASDRFYKIIDVAVKEISNSETVFFVRVSGHHPVEWAKTWDPNDLGPFKQIVADEIRRVDQIRSK